MMESRPKILIVEDSPSLARCHEAYLQKESFATLMAATGNIALQLIREHQPQVVLLDIQLPDINGLDLIQKAHDMNFSCIFIVMTDHGSTNLAVESMRVGALDYLEKPFSRDRLIVTVNNALERYELQQQSDAEDLLEESSDDIDTSNYYGFIGNSLEMQSIYRTIDAAAQSKATVFITGESGTGKEVCAHAIHLNSPRRNKEFVAINCAAIPRDLMESEIFGHVKGAFTGANSNREGAAARADGGTLFLDEIGEMDMDLQSKLLRFIQTGTIQKVGSNQLEKVDVRFVCATNRDPLEQVRKGEFREDLYYRLHVIPIGLPPLRKRGEDVLIIARQFLLKFAEEEEKDFQRFSPETEQLFLKYGWPGNIRQLQNVVRNIVVLNNAPEVELSMLPPPLDNPEQALRQPVEVFRQEQPWNVTPIVASAQTIEGTKTSSVAMNVIRKMLVEQSEGPSDEQQIKELWRVEMETIETAIRVCGNNIPKAAKRLGVSPSTIYRKRQTWKDMGFLSEL